MFAEQFANVRYRKSRSSGDQNLKNLTDSQRAELLHAYQQEFAALTLDTMKEEMPLGLIRFTTEEEEQAIAWWNQKENRNQAEMYPWRYSIRYILLLKRRLLCWNSLAYRLTIAVFLTRSFP